MFSDESRFSLQCDSRRTLLWRAPGTRYHQENTFERHRYGGAGWLVWGEIILGSRTDLHVQSVTMTGHIYRDVILEQHSVNPIPPVYRKFGGHYLMSGVIFQDQIDNLILSMPRRYAPKIQKFQFPDKLEVNEKVGVICMLRSGKPPYAFRWLKDSKELNSGNGVIIQTGERLSNLLIDPITHASAGNYTCLVKNSAGIDSFSSILTVTASPSWNEEPFDVETVVGEKYL
ncbi:down syndrome cell adhesion molecule [Trichonephila clavipes]|nr:down syndrome cell adhesion molecule [Trichonephila clavipes]